MTFASPFLNCMRANTGEGLLSRWTEKFSELQHQPGLKPFSHTKLIAGRSQEPPGFQGFALSLPLTDET